MKTSTTKFDSASSTSPCVRNCCLDEEDVCMGCGRHIEEIIAWHQASAAEREKILGLSVDRLKKRAARQRSAGS